jgi:eukaryotic-like serine/threonine-protein kinase
VPRTLTRSRTLLLVAAFLAGTGCRRVRPAVPPLFPVSTEWRVILDDTLEGPLATDGERIYGATRDGAVIALDRRTGLRAWQVKERPGVLSFGGGTLVVRGAHGVVWGLDPATGAARWQTDAGVAGTLPATVTGDRVLVAGEGLAALELLTGRKLWEHAEAGIVSAPPVLAGAWVLVGEAGGALRCRDAATGASRWSFDTGGPIIAAPVVDDRAWIFLGTTTRRVVALGFDKGQVHWRWKTGADVQVPAALFGDKVLVASHEDVLYALKRGGGDLVWRAALPSRPLAGPIVVGTAVLVACHENEVVGFEGRTGTRLGALRAPAEIRTAPVMVERLLYLGLRDRSVVALKLGAGEPSPAPSASERRAPPSPR